MPRTREIDITAANLRVGDIVLGGGSEITIATLESIPADDIYPRGGVRYIGRISAGRDLGYCGSWSVQADQPETVRRVAGEESARA